jgi:hypothetical protein
MTLIATVWSPQGFAIAADGIEVLDGVETTIKEGIQKIFDTTFINETGFAWAWVGNVGAELKSGSRYDLKEITQRVMAGLPDDAYLDDPESYFDRIALRIFYELPTDVILSGLEDGDDEIIFVGYLAGKPLWREIIFQRRGAMFLQYVVTEPKTSLGDFYVFAGSSTVRKQMQDSGALRQPLDLSEAINAVYTYTKTCVESRGSVLDCKNLGGHIHVAAVTREGFSWDIEPIREKEQ